MFLLGPELCLFSSHETKSQVSFTDPTASVVVRSSALLTFQIKAYSFYSFLLILTKLGMYHHWANALQNCVRIRNLTPGGSSRAT